VLNRALRPIAVLILAAPALSRCQAQLQRTVDHALGNSAGAIVVSDVESGKVLAQKNITLAANQLVRPGSTLKPFVLEELLRTKRINSKQKALCRRPLRIGSLRLDCSHAIEVKELDAEEAITYSCNSYLAEVSLQLNQQELTELLRRAGLDSPTRLAHDEAVGRIARPATREQLQLMALGLRGIEVTPMELLEAYRKLALRRAVAGDAETNSIYAGLDNAVKYGTAHSAFVEGLDVAGKTGTATNETGSMPHGLFIGYAPAEHPEIAIVVYVTQSRGRDAAAVAQQVFAQYRQTGKRP
jgi:cell division protein FtsI/penicillin-binding protein 2